MGTPALCVLSDETRAHFCWRDSSQLFLLVLENWLLEGLYFASEFRRCVAFVYFSKNSNQAY